MRLHVIPLILSIILISSCDAFIIEVPQHPVEQNTTKTNTTNTTVVVEEKKEETLGFFYPVISNNVSIYVLDLEGRSIIVADKFFSFLIDSGLESDAQKILKNLRNMEITELDYVLLTNSNEKRVGGMPYIIVQASPAKVYETGISSPSSNYKLYKELYNNDSITIPTDFLFSFGDVFVRLIVPYDDGGGFSQNDDDNTIVTKLTHGDINILMMSDCQFDCIERLKDESLKSDILIIEGGCDSITLTFIQQVDPKEVVVTGELCAETKEKLEFMNIPFYETIKKGNLKIESDGEKFKVRLG